MVTRFARVGWLTFWRLPRWAASSHGIIKYCTTYEATAPVNFDSPPQHEHWLGTYHSPCTALRRTVGTLPKGRQILCCLALTGAADVFAKSAFRDGFSIHLELADEGTIVAIVCGENMGSHNDEEDAMRWPLFTWILGGGIFGMFWFVYLSIKQHEKHWKPVAHT
jgi:hypothetical protein